MLAWYLLQSIDLDVCSSITGKSMSSAWLPQHIRCWYITTSTWMSSAAGYQSLSFYEFLTLLSGLSLGYPVFEDVVFHCEPVTDNGLIGDVERMGQYCRNILTRELFFPRRPSPIYINNIFLTLLIIFHTSAVAALLLFFRIMFWAKRYRLFLYTTVIGSTVLSFFCQFAWMFVSLSIICYSVLGNQSSRALVRLRKVVKSDEIRKGTWFDVLASQLTHNE